ncbi:MAG TPA: histidine kinase [Gemmatimonadaceae bacterium]|nr:histidine kinase [Gemmatimonadaceae bacterium]
MQQPKRTAPSWLWPTFLVFGVVVALVALGQYAEPPAGLRAPVRGSGPTLPRMPGPAPDFPSLLYLLGVGSMIWYAVVLAFPLLLLGARRVDAERQGRLRAIAVPAASVFALIATTSVLHYWLLYREAPMRPGLGAYLPQALRIHVLPWIAVAGIAGAIEARRRAVHAALDRERLRTQIAEQRLIALTGQLHPHFLFNTLQGISTLIHRDPDAADEMLAKLSDLLRDLLRHRDQALVPLGDELRYARTYLEIAQLRFADRLEFQLDVAPSVDQASVPLFILQPLVENALAHGIGGRTRGGRVTVKAARRGERLMLEVADDGAGLTTSTTPRQGIGLSNTRERLRATFDGDHAFSLEPLPTGGAVARIDIPFRLHGRAPGE